MAGLVTCCFVVRFFSVCCLSVRSLSPHLGSPAASSEQRELFLRRFHFLSAKS